MWKYFLSQWFLVKLIWCNICPDLMLQYLRQFISLGVNNNSFPWRNIGVSQVTESTCQCRRCGLNTWVGKSPWRRKWQPTPVILPGQSRGQRSLVGCNPWDHKESDTTELLSTREIRAFDFRMLPQTPRSFGDYTVHSIYTLLLL